ncbi:MAG: cupin domain-containing protein [Methylococcales bacterium]
MTNKPKFQDDFSAAEQAELNRLLLEGLALITPELGQQDVLKTQVLARITQSLAKQAGVLTVRLKDGVWRTLTSGIRYKPLWSGSAGNSVLIELAPGAALPQHRHNWLEEGMVLRGDLHMGDLQLGPLDYHMSPLGSRHGRIHSDNGALAFLRGTSLGHKPGVLTELLGGLIPGKGDACLTVFDQDNHAWLAITDGVFIKELCSDAQQLSRMVRLQAGATWTGGSHQHDTEYMLLAGEVFLNDVLLQAGDYQLAAAGSCHADIYTDVGATLFIRGDPDF